MRTIWMPAILLTALVVASARPSLTELQAASYSEPYFRGQVLNRAIKEASGLASSQIHSDKLWMINDSGDAPMLYAVDTSGVSLGEFTIEDVENRDWEDLASFKIDGEAYLLIADVGDNDAKYENIRLHVIAEPKDFTASTLPVDWTIQATLEGGANDVESVFVDSNEQQIYLLSKRRYPNLLYSMPLKPEQPVVAKKVGEVANIPATSEPGNRQNQLFGDQPTSMDISLDQRFVIVLTYNDLYLFERQADQSWPDALSAHPKHITTPPLMQAEAVTFGRSNHLILTSEGWPAPILELMPLP